MPLRHEFDKMPNYLIVRSSGTVESMAELQCYLNQLFTYCDQENCGRIMSDERQIDYSFSTLEHFEIAEWIERESFNEQIERAATLTSEDQYMNLKDLELFTSNRGLNFRIFSSEKHAASWLDGR